MSVLGVLRILEGGRVSFWCPGCEVMHAVRVSAPSDNWQFDGNYDRPTFSPSILVTGTNITPKGEEQYRAWCDAGMPTPAPKLDSVPSRCHSFVRAGQIEFLGDCTHALAGKTVPLKEPEV